MLHLANTIIKDSGYLFLAVRPFLLLLSYTNFNSFPCPVSPIHVIWHLTISISSWKPLDSSSSGEDGRKGVKWYTGFFKRNGNTNHGDPRDFRRRASSDQETGTISQSFYRVSIGVRSELWFRGPYEGRLLLNQKAIVYKYENIRAHANCRRVPNHC